MKRRIFALALCLVVAGTAKGLDPEPRRLADRYLAILRANPAQQTAFDRLWKIHADTGETDALLAACRERASENPVLYARVLLRAGQEAEAKRALREVAGPANVAAAEMLAGMLEKEGEIHGAAELIEKAAAVHESQSLLVRLGELFQRAGEPDKSRAAWERAVALAPRDLGLRKRLAAASAQAGHGKAAIDHLQVIAERGSPSERFAAWSEISLRFEEAGEMEQAIASQEALLALMGPDHWQLDSARRRLLNLHRENHSLTGLEKRWREEAESRPRDPLPALRLAKLYEFQGDEASRRDWLVKAATLLPKDIRLACEVAALDLSMGHPQAAADRYDKALALRPDDGDIIFLRAEASALLGQESDAEKRIEDYLAAHKDDDAAVARTMDFYRRMRLSAPLERRLSATSLARPDDEQAASELARFYVEERRDAEAAECLLRFDSSRLDSRDAAAVAFRFSELLKGSGAREDVLRWARAAFEKDPSRPEYALRLADLLQAENQIDATVEVLRQACETSEGAPPREDLDRRLFLALQSKERATPDEHDKSVGPAVKEMIASLDRHAQKARSEAPWLRLARWLRWTDSRSSPVGALRKGLEAVPQSTALQEALAVQLADSGDFASAIEAFKRLAELAPDRRAEIQRKIGHAELDGGNHEEGLRIFQSLAQDSKDWQAVADLALAQQMGGNWFDAFETWQRAYGLASPSARRAIRAPILNAATRLQLYPRGLDFLEEACVAEGDAEARKELLNEAAAYALEHGLAEEWRSRLDRRTQASSETLHWREGLIALLTAEGRAEEARQALRASMKDNEDSVEGVERLIKSAEEAADWEEAARLARRLASSIGTQDPSPLMRQAGFLERAGRREDAEAVWQTLAARHARTPPVLSAAGDFFERVGRYERAEESYRAATRFRGCAPQVYLRLGRFALDRGDRSQALLDFETLLAETRPEIDSLRDCLPLPDRVLFAPPQPARPGAPSAAEWKVASEADNQGCRLLAIREAGQLLAQSPKKQKWVEKFSTPIERIWARHYSGDKAGSFLDIERLVSAEETSAAIEQGFAALALEEEEAGILGRWASDSGKGRWESVLAALSRMLHANWRPSAEFLTRVFAYAPALPRWRASEFLAQKNLLRTACALGETVPDALPGSQASSAWIELARWGIAQRDPDEAITRLDRAIECAPSALSFSEPLFAALRARWLLTPESQRAEFEQEVTARLKTSKHRRSEKAAAALIASLKGDDSLAAERIAESVHDLGTSNDESWAEFVQQGGNQLEEWDLHRLARDLYRSDLARNSALLSMRGENFHDSTSDLLILSQLVAAGGNRISYLLNEWLARGVSDRKLLDAVVRLQHSSGRAEAAAAVYKRLCERNPRSEGICAGILNLARNHLMRKSGTAYLERLLAEEFPGLGRAMIQTAGVRLASILDEEGDYDRSLALLDRLGRDGALNKALLLQQIQALCKMGRHREALAALERNPFFAASPEFTIPLAELYAAFGRERDAYPLLEREARSGSANRRAAAAKLSELAVQANDAPRAAMAETLLGTVAENPPSQGRIPVSEGDWKRALSEIDNPAMTQEERFRASRSFLVLQQNLPAKLRVAELARLKRIAMRSRSLTPEYYVLRKELAEKFGSTTDLLKELLAEWDEGRGNYYAGEIAIQILADQKRYDALGRILNDYLADEHFNEEAWDQVGRRLLLEKQYELAARAFSELSARSSGDSVRALMLAEALAMSGRHDAAEAIASPLKRIANFDPQKHIDLAEFYLKINRLADAKVHLLAAPVDVRSGTAWIHATDRFLARNDFTEARACVLHALKTPQAVPTRALADYYWRSGEIFRLAPRANEFNLPPRQFRDLQIELARRLVAENDTNRAWGWIESVASLLDDAQGRSLLQSVEHGDWDRAGRLWETTENSLWEARCAAAQFFLRRSQVTESAGSALKDLARAHELHPGSFSIAQAYIARLLRRNEPAAARKILRDVIDAYADPGDRRAARQMLASLQASPSLPRGN